MEINAIQIYKVDLKKDSVESIEQSEFSTDFEDYLNGLVELITSGSSGRQFRFDRDTTEVYSQIIKSYKGENFAESTAIIANRLYESEVTIQAKIKHLKKEIQKGILVIASINDREAIKYIICKADHNEYLDEINFLHAKGLPIKKKIFKAFSALIDSNGIANNITVYDSNTVLSDYWWKSFLELSKLYSDEDNTENAFDAIDKGVFTKMKEKHPADYTYLRNASVHFFRSREKFDLNEYLDLIDNYEPVDSSLNKGDLIKRVKELPTKSRKPFDEQFTIVKSKLTARIINKVRLSNQIELILKEDVRNLKDVITAGVDDDGTKYVKVRSEMGYKFFNDLSKSNDS